MKKVHKTINKNIKMLLIIAAATVVATAVLLVLIAGNEERNQIPTDPTRSTETKESEAPTDVNETTVATEEGVSQEAQLLYDARVDDMNDPATVAKLLETIDLKKKVANYRVTLLVKESPKSMTITFDKTVSEEGKKALDEDMQKYAQQILALTRDAEKVQWVYTVEGEDKKKEDRTVYHDTSDAKKVLNYDVKKYGESAKSVQALLDKQYRKDIR